MKKSDEILRLNPIYIVDVGANGGIHNRWKNFTNLYKEILFEPEYQGFINLQKNKKEHTILFNTALDGKQHSTKFNVASDQRNSSFFLPNTEFLKKFPNPERFSIQEKVQIETATLDFVYGKDGFNECDFLKLDTQGSELSILQGAQNVLKETIGIQVEVGFIEIYKEQPRFSDIDGFLTKDGFDLFDLKRFYWKRKGYESGAKKGQLIFGDCLYLKSPESIIQSFRSQRDKIIKAICIYLVYGYYDVAMVLFEQFKALKLLDSNELENLKALLNQYKPRYLLPFFRGKATIANLLKRFANIFEVSSFYYGTDEYIGNMKD